LRKKGKSLLIRFYRVWAIALMYYQQRSLRFLRINQHFAGILPYIALLISFETPQRQIRTTESCGKNFGTAALSFA